MSLINCPDCKELVSDKANTCPNCGHPFFADKLSRNARDLSTKATQGLLTAKTYSKENASRAFKTLKRITKLFAVLVVAISSIIYLKNYYFLSKAEDLLMKTCNSYIGKTITYKRPASIYSNRTYPEVTVTVPQDIQWDEMKSRVSWDYDFDIPYVGATTSLFGTSSHGTRWECTPFIKTHWGSYLHPYSLKGIRDLQPAN